MSGPVERTPASDVERESLRSLKRGAYAKVPIKQGEQLSCEKLFFAMPVQDGQLIADDWRADLVADQDYETNSLIAGTVANKEEEDDALIFDILLQVRAMLNRARISINDDASIEISHHYGLQRFREHGAVIITCINRDYAKKLIIQLPRQKHPYHHHRRKEETFQLLFGDMEITKDGYKKSLVPGEAFLVEPKAWHKFHTLDGAIVEEVSSTHFNDNSFYEDPKIAKMERRERKTNVDNWRDFFISHRNS